jgi:surface antigen
MAEPHQSMEATRARGAGLVVSGLGLIEAAHLTQLVPCIDMRPGIVGIGGGSLLETSQRRRAIATALRAIPKLHQGLHIVWGSSQDLSAESFRFVQQAQIT